MVEKATDDSVAVDVIRRLNPADFADDEFGNGALGVALLMSAGAAVEYHATDDAGDAIDIWSVEYGDGDVCVSIPARLRWNAERHFYRRTAGGRLVSLPNPALSYDILLPIVQEWCGRDRNREMLLELEVWRVRDREHWGHYLTWTWMSPRQLAQAFLAAAREVGA